MGVTTSVTPITLKVTPITLEKPVRNSCNQHSRDREKEGRTCIKIVIFLENIGVFSVVELVICKTSCRRRRCQDLGRLGWI